MRQVQCEGCGESTPDYDIVSYGTTGQGYRDLCSRCFNAEVAKHTGHESFANVSFEPIWMVDRAGERHEFHFQTRLLGDVVALDAFELRDGSPAGYRFQLVGQPGNDVFVLLGRLIEKMRRALSTQHLTDGEYGLQIADRTVRGRIEWDDSAAERTPLIVVDGQEISWEDFGRMLMTFEGWQFKLEISDPSEKL
ncbi:MAG: hypothetical protein HZT41_09730 [Dechloromonas sp.]|nr:MAG: hypothetical protein HZT41_09730 [Dechloromonas sp.]